MVKISMKNYHVVTRSGEVVELMLEVLGSSPEIGQKSLMKFWAAYLVVLKYEFKHNKLTFLKR
jgi:hypothetical protein